MKVGEFKRSLKKDGCFLHKHGKRHDIWINPANGNTAPISRHDGQEIPTGTLESILKQLGLK